MIDITPLDVRKKRGDFRKQLRGYDPVEVDQFLDLVAERLEELVKENLTLRERTERLQEQVSSQQGREKAVQDALVTAQQLRDDIRGQARREADELRLRAEREAEDLRVRTEQEIRLARREAEAEARRTLEDAERKVEERQRALEELERNRLRFLKGFRQLLQRELDMVEVEEARTPVDEVAVDLELGGGRAGRSAAASVPAEEEEPVDPDAPVHELAHSALEGGEEEPSTGTSPDEIVLQDAEEEPPDGDGGPVGRLWQEGQPGPPEAELWLPSILDEENEEEEDRKE